MKKDFLASPWATITAGLLATLLFAAAVRFGYVEEDARLVLLAAVGGCFVSIVAAAPALFWKRHSDEMEEQVFQSNQQALTDELTGLPNRTGMLRYLERAVEEANRTDTAVGVLFLDLDRFKVINDSLGHETGDAMLQEVAQRVDSAVRASDVVARFGGDEFVVITRGLLNAASSISIAQQILAAFEQPLPLPQGGEHVVTPSIGIATADETNPRTPRELVRDADAAMYRAKRTKSGYALFDEEQRKDALSRLDVERALRAAIDDRDLEVYYQPIVDTESRTMASMEALVRWNRAGFGFVGPDTFLPIAEEAGLISPIGEEVLREACAQASLWNRELMTGRDISVGVNVAERQLIDSAFVDRVAEVLRWSGLPPEQLTIEITEDIMLAHLDSSLTVLRDVKELGVNLAIDDFGTGRSSLSYIAELDMVDYLKIDKRFIDDVVTNPVDLAIVEAITTLARAVGLGVVAEGVESEEQYDILRGLGVERIQGYLFQRPLNATDLEAAIAAGEPPLPTASTPRPAPPPTVAPTPSPVATPRPTPAPAQPTAPPPQSTPVRVSTTTSPSAPPERPGGRRVTVVASRPTGSAAHAAESGERRQREAPSPFPDPETLAEMERSLDELDELDESVLDQPLDPPPPVVGPT